HCEHGVAIACVKTNMHVLLSVVALRQRHEDSGDKRIALNRVQMSADQANNLQVVRRTIFSRLSVTNMLPDWVFIWEKLFCEFLVDDDDAARILLFAFSLSKIAAAQQFH